MTPEQKQLIRKEWEDAVETANDFTDYIKMSGSRTLNADAIAYWWLDRYEPIVKETERVTEERIVEKILTMKKSKKQVTKGDGICGDCGHSWIDAECACDNNEFVDRAINLIRNK